MGMATLESFGAITPHNLKERSDEELLEIMILNAGGAFDTWARNELERRRMNKLTYSVDKLHETTKEVSTEINSLAQSSGILEGMTNRLIWLTGVLIALTVLQLIFLIWDRVDKWEAEQAIKHFWIL
jgi:hypothetical protein